MTARAWVAGWALLLPVAAFAQAPPAVEDADIKAVAVAKELLAAHNKERAEAGLGPLVLEPHLGRAADAHARDMAAHAKMSHEGSDKSSPFDRMKRASYHYQNAAENVAMSQPTVADVMRDWMASPHHKENILGKFTEMGVGLAQGAAGENYWCVTFGTPWPKLEPARAATELLEALNAGRKKADKPALASDAKLQQAAEAQAKALASQAGPGDGAAIQEALVQRLKEAGYAFRGLSQMASFGQATAEEVAHTWLEGKGYRELVLGAFPDAGIGYAADATGRPYWVLLLAKPATP